MDNLPVCQMSRDSLDNAHGLCPAGIETVVGGQCTEGPWILSSKPIDFIPGHSHGLPVSPQTLSLDNVQ